MDRTNWDEKSSARHALQVDVFYLLDCQSDSWSRELQTVEAEVAFLLREAGQWLVEQTEYISAHRNSGTETRPAQFAANGGRLHRPPVNVTSFYFFEVG
jgi:hypothetical protein